jgi:hypothetical protein
VIRKNACIIKCLHKTASDMDGSHGPVTYRIGLEISQVGVKCTTPSYTGHSDLGLSGSKSSTVDVCTRAVESESEGILGGVGVGKNVPTPTPTSV